MPVVAVVIDLRGDGNRLAGADDDARHPLGHVAQVDDRRSIAFDGLPMRLLESFAIHPGNRDIGAPAGEQVQFHRIAFVQCAEAQLLRCRVVGDRIVRALGRQAIHGDAANNRRNRCLIAGHRNVQRILLGSCGRKIHHRLTIRRHGKRGTRG